MRTTFEQFVEARMPITGLVACAARLPDGMVIHHCFNRWLQPAQIRQAMARLAQSTELLSPHQIEPVRLAWTFEHLRVHLGLGPDKSCLALFMENRADQPLCEVDTLLDEFASLPSA